MKRYWKLWQWTPGLAVWLASMGWLGTTGMADTNRVQEAELKLDVPTTAKRTISRAQEAERGQLARRRVNYSGILVQVGRSPKPWQWLNPAAPMSLGRGEEHVVRDPHTGQADGLSFFTIRY